MQVPAGMGQSLDAEVKAPIITYILKRPAAWQTARSDKLDAMPHQQQQQQRMDACLLATSLARLVILAVFVSLSVILSFSLSLSHCVFLSPSSLNSPLWELICMKGVDSCILTGVPEWEAHSGAYADLFFCIICFLCTHIVCHFSSFSLSHSCTSLSSFLLSSSY